MSWFTVGDEHCSYHGLTLHMNGYCCLCNDDQMEEQMEEEIKEEREKMINIKIADTDELLCENCNLPIHPNLPCEEVMLFHNTVDEEYFRLLRLIVSEGRRKKNRTGIDTIGVFGAQAKFDVDLNAFPVLTTKKIYFRSIVHELLWFIRGDTNIKYLVDNNVSIWNEWAYKRFLNRDKGSDNKRYDDYIHTFEDYIKEIKNDGDFAKKYGDLGEGTYGGMWRDFPHFKQTYASPDHLCSVGDEYEREGVDQLKKVIDKLKTNPDDRRIIVTAWHPYWSEKCALSPCHCFIQFNTEELTNDERDALATKEQRNEAGSQAIDAYDKEGTYFEELTKLGIPKRRLNCLMLIRSNDMFLGAPFNLTSYSLLTAMISHCVGMTPGTLIYTIGDCHLYINHLSQVKEQMARLPKVLPKLWLNPEVTDLFSFKYEDISLINYDSHPAIKGEVAV